MGAERERKRHGPRDRALEEEGRWELVFKA